MTEDSPYLEHIESKQIDKLIESIYGNNPEDTVVSDTPIPKVETTPVEEKIDQLLQSMPKKEEPKKRVFFFRKKRK